MKIHQMPLLPLPHPVGSCCGDNLLTISYNPVTISFVSKGLGSQRAPPRGPSPLSPACMSYLLCYLGSI